MYEPLTFNKKIVTCVRGLQPEHWQQPAQVRYVQFTQLPGQLPAWRRLSVHVSRSRTRTSPDQFHRLSAATSRRRVSASSWKVSPVQHF